MIKKCLFQRHNYCKQLYFSGSNMQEQSPPKRKKRKIPSAATRSKKSALSSHQTISMNFPPTVSHVENTIAAAACADPSPPESQHLLYSNTSPLYRAVVVKRPSATCKSPYV
jgi:hypothetical protein